MTDNSPTRMEDVNKGGNVRVNQRGRRLRAVVGHIERKRKVTTMIHVERRETSLGIDGGVVGYLKMREIASPSGVSSRNATGEEKVAKRGVEALSKPNGLMVSSCRWFQPSTDS